VLGVASLRSIRVCAAPSLYQNATCTKFRWCKAKFTHSPCLGRLADEIDDDKSGTLEEEELKAFLEKLEIKANYQEVRVLFARLDYSGNGSLTYPDFMDRLNNWKKNAKQSNKAPKAKVSLPVSQPHTISVYKPSRRSDEFVCEARVLKSHGEEIHCCDAGCRPVKVEGQCW
jgi:hypothetical protein